MESELRVKKKPISKIVKNMKKGQLHKDMGVSPGEKIPPSKLAAAAKKKGKVGQRARFAQTLKKMGGKKRGK